MAAGGMRIAVVGGTGELGAGLAFQLARAGYEVIIGSRSAGKAEQVAGELRGELPASSIRGADNVAAAASGELVVLTVPFANHDATLESIRDQLEGKILVDTTVPLVPPKVMRVQLPAEGAVARRAQQLLGEGVRVVSAFQNVAATHLRHDRLGASACDVLVTGDDVAARETVVGIAERIGLKAWHAGPIDNSVVAEALTSVLIFLNKKYNLDGAGIRVVGNPKRAT